MQSWEIIHRTPFEVGVTTKAMAKKFLGDTLDIHGGGPRTHLRTASSTSVKAVGGGWAGGLPMFIEHTLGTLEPYQGLLDRTLILGHRLPWHAKYAKFRRKANPTTQLQGSGHRVFRLQLRSLQITGCYISIIAACRCR